MKRQGFFSLMKTAMQRAFVAQTTIETNPFPPLSAPVVFRPYRDNDYDPCIAIYRKNEPGRFPPGHISDFEQFLRRDAKTCIIAEVDSKVVACGGLLLEAPAEPEIRRYGRLGGLRYEGARRRTIASTS